MLRRSQVCSALRGLRPLGLALRATAAQRWAKLSLGKVHKKMAGRQAFGLK
ncbi:hypothetical protein SapgrDRAFT_0179 [Saprospira grandis DSM 2844]|uniref:Uncharacterized protein n=1 Tax=Saprospira grandis DSM 2844 TaxID=694433 RepID=J1I0Z3_9BACT|nr:hypothetical protein SapgrDRAFT_0179 [Saprospira grandis DSM 2844]